MIFGRLNPTASIPLNNPNNAPNRTPPSAAIHGSTPFTMRVAAMTAEKLNIQPTDKSISRMANKKTIASAIMP